MPIAVPAYRHAIPTNELQCLLLRWRYTCDNYSSLSIGGVHLLRCDPIKLGVGADLGAVLLVILRKVRFRFYYSGRKIPCLLRTILSRSQNPNYSAFTEV